MAKILLVEDDNNLREIYEARMQAEGYDVIAAKDGEEALVVAKAENPELIISDVMMPKISGFEMLDIIRNTDGLKDVKVIMLTALGQTDDQLRADRLGADRYLVKSQVTLEDIVNVTHQLLGDLPQAEVPAVPEPTAVAATPPVAPPEKPVVSSPAPAPIQEPVVASVAPAAPEPVAPTYSAVQVDPPAETSPAEPVSTDQQTAAQEEAAVEAQIEDFVAGATSDVSTSDSLSSQLATPQTDTATIDPVASTSDVDDKLMADALAGIGGTPSSDTARVAVPPSQNPANEPVEPQIVPDQTSQPPDVVLQTAGPVSMIAGKKIISPMSPEQAKPDINALLAQEEAKEIASNFGSVAPSASEAPALTSEAKPVAITPMPGVQAPIAPEVAPLNIVTPPVDPNKPDPHSIAL